MILAKFGYETFYVNSSKGFYTPDGLSFEYGKQTETQGTTGQKPVSYITALNLIKSSFKIRLDSRFVNIEEKRTAWREMAESNKLYTFSLGGVYVSKNKFTVLSLKESNFIINGRGKILSVDLDITIEEYAGTSSTIGILQKRLADYE